MGSVLVTYATKTGCTKGIAEKIHHSLGAAGLDATLAGVRDEPDPSAYDAVVVGSGVRMGQWHPAARTWVKSHADVLKQRPVAFFTVGLTLVSEPGSFDVVRGYTTALEHESGVEPVDVGMFAGCYVPKEFSLVERTILKSMGYAEGDHRDWPAIEQWSLEVAAKLVG